MNKDILQSHHEAWLQNPVTKESASILLEMRKNIIDDMCSKVFTTDVPDIRFRIMAGQLKLLQQIENKVYVSTSFIARTQQS